MLMKCPECELQISDKAPSCPHCGFPLRPETRPRKARSKRRRLPNGFGQISEIKGQNLRKPFRAMITVGKNKSGRPICKTLRPEAYFKTYNEAYTALVEYHKNPYNMDASTTVEELYKKWLTKYEKTVESVNAVKTAWRYCSAVYKMQVRELRARHIKACIDEGTAVIKGYEKKASPTTKNQIKTIFNQMLDYALEYELVDRNYSRTFKLDDEVIKELKKVKKDHIVFTENEMDLLWQHVDDIPFVPIMLIQCYSGWRPQEMCLIKLEDVDLEKWIFTGGLKTPSGKEREVPIHSKIQHLVEREYKKSLALGNIYLISYGEPHAKHKDITMTYNRYRGCFSKVRDKLGLTPDHRPHDCRKQFVSMAKKYKVDDYAIKYIVGHKISDITEKVYTQREFSWLREEIEKIK